MGYYSPGTPGGGDGHGHPNKAVLDQITSTGSGKIITDAERQAIGRFVAAHGSHWSGAPPATTDEAVNRIAALLTQHLGNPIPTQESSS